MVLAFRSKGTGLPSPKHFSLRPRIWLGSVCKDKAPSLGWNPTESEGARDCPFPEVDFRA